ncbi:hypothetical protein PVA45_08425 (plasmid) [Entomospira entomophila]|uniref:Uncharacterized protein n=1 Tax=Entomospira entomophila TaxID=2719988 RepID=A0A968GDL3_9SPIO|nr:hypothetical protein [Entomospira entomophilus]NIZ41516.1 hypothetical protein [Entomospira entomophilus]WDI36400.1 hypothetical protein PVA45_08425 [Entomospira entomophilus]
MVNREVVGFNHDVFLRGTTHFERKERLAFGYHYKIGMLLNRGTDGILKPYVSGDSERGFFIAVSEQDLTSASDILETPVVVTGQFWADLLILPEGVTLASNIDGLMLIDLLRMSGLNAVDRHYTYYDATPIFDQGEA